MKATVRDLAKLRAMGLVAGDAGKEVISLAVCNGDGLRRETSDFSLELHCNCYLSILPCTRGMCPQLHLSTASSLASRQGCKCICSLLVLAATLNKTLPALAFHYIVYLVVLGNCFGSASVLRHFNSVWQQASSTSSLTIYLLCCSFVTSIRHN